MYDECELAGEWTPPASGMHGGQLTVVGFTAQCTSLFAILNCSTVDQRARCGTVQRGKRCFRSAMNPVTLLARLHATDSATPGTHQVQPSPARLPSPPQRRRAAAVAPAGTGLCAQVPRVQPAASAQALRRRGRARARLLGMPWRQGREEGRRVRALNEEGSPQPPDTRWTTAARPVLDPALQDTMAQSRSARGNRRKSGNGRGRGCPRSIVVFSKPRVSTESSRTRPGT